MTEFRRRYAGKYQIPIVYVWHDEIAAGELGPEVPLTETAPEPEPAPTAIA
jgi:D-aminopeptidase